MLKHRIKSKSQSRSRHYSQGSNSSIVELIDIGGLFSPPPSSTSATTPNSAKYYQLSPTRGCSSASVSTTTLPGALSACFSTGQRWSSSSGGFLSNYREHKSDDDDDGDIYDVLSGTLNSNQLHQNKHKINTTSHNVAAVLTSPAKSKQSFRLSKRRTSANPSTVAGGGGGGGGTTLNNISSTTSTCSSGSQEVMRRWNSFHSTRGECHPNRFRRNRKSTAPHIDSTHVINKLANINLYHRTQSPPPPQSQLSSSTCGIKNSISNTNENISKTKSSNLSVDYSSTSSTSLLAQHYQHHNQHGRHSISYQSRFAVAEDTKRITKSWYLKRGKSLVDDKAFKECSINTSGVTFKLDNEQIDDDLNKIKDNEISESSQYNYKERPTSILNEIKYNDNNKNIDDIEEYIDDVGTPDIGLENVPSNSLSPQNYMGFGKRNGGSCRRSSECFVLESSEMIVIEYPEIASVTTNFVSPSHVQQQSLKRNNCSIIKNSILNTQDSGLIGKVQNIVDSLPSSPASNILPSVSSNNNINASNKNNNLQQSAGVQQQFNQKTHSQSPILSPASTGSLSILSVAAISLSPVSGSRTNLVLSGGSTPINTCEINLPSSLGNSSLPRQLQLPYNSQHVEKNQHKSHLNTFSIPVSGSLGINSNTQHHRNSTPAVLYTINNLSLGGVNQSNTINSNINLKSLNMDPHHIRHSGLPGNRPELYQKCNRGSHSSDTSSAYSGSDTMTSVHSSSLDTDEVDLSGLVESVVDSDEEDLAESMDSLNVRDAVRDCLEKDPSERTEDDIEALLELTQGLKAFTNMTLAVRRALCSVMVFAVVDKAGTMVMSDGEELDSWSVLINGHVEIEHKNGEKEELHVGDSFGILPTMDKLYHRGVMRTKCDDCQFVCITQTDYYRIQHQGEENTKRHEDENGQVVMVTELRQIGPDAPGANSRRGHVVIRGTISRLMLQLIEENSITDPTYVEDFLLTHRTFIENPKEVAKQLLLWFENEDTSPLATSATGMEVRDRVSRVILLWVNNHFTDFETDPEMMEFLETFETGLEQKQMPGQLRLLHIACSAKARTRNVTLTRSSRDEDLHFKIIGPTERGSYGIFVSYVERKTKAEDVGLKRGDQILEVNGQSFEHVTYTRAMEILMGSTHLSITVKSNLLAFKEMLQQPDTKSPRSKYTRSKICVSDLAKLNSNNSRQAAAAVARLSTHELLSTSVMQSADHVDYCQSPCRDLQTQGSNNNNNCVTSSFVSNLLHNSSRKDQSHSSNSTSNKSGFMTLGPKRRIQKALIKMNLLPKNNSFHPGHQGNNPGSISDFDDHSSTSSLSANNNSDSKGLINSGIGSAGSLSGSRSNNNSNNSSNKNNSANSNSSQISISRNKICNSSSSSLYHSHSNPDLTTVSSNTIGNITDTNEIEQNSQSNSVKNTNITNIPLNISANSQTIATPQQSGPVYYEDTRQSDYPEHVLKVYKSDQTCKYLLINKETTAHEVVMLALQEFGIHETSSNFSLCEVSVSEGGMIKQRRLPEHLQNLAERIGLSARYYLKTNGITETLVPDDLAPDLIRESIVHLLQLNANEVAIQLTFQDFAIFRQIESTEYVDDLFEIKSRYGTPMLKQFSELVNREMFWVVTEVCSEHNMVRRMKIVKQFIKIARHCKECRNFNSMFAIISGLGHAAVSRLRQTWEKLPTKYQKLFNDLQDLMDPSRNMSKYRQLVSAELLAQHPIIPFYPVVKKDLTFIHLGNDTRVESLINFEKLRMIAKEVRLLTHMCSSTYDLLTMLEFKGQPPSSAMVALNQMSVSTASCVGNCSSNNSSNANNTGVSSVIGGTITGVSNLLYVGGGNATVKRRKKSAAAPNPKKMFEEAQMVRRVKAYLNNMKIITDEDALHNLSLECEQSSGGHGGGSGSISGNSAPNTTVTVRKRHPSPTLSTTSSTSSTSEGKKGNLAGTNVGPKFGTASPQAVKKILSLSESTKTRPHQPRHPGIQLPLVNVGSLHHSFPHTSISPSPSPGSHRRMGSCSSTSTVSSNIANSGNGNIAVVSPTGAVLISATRGIHERSHSDTPTPLPSVDLSAESSSVTSLSNLPLRKNITLAGSVTSNDSGHGSCVQAEIHSNYSDSSSSGLYHVASSIVHNSPSPTLQQRRHSSTVHAGLYICTPTATSPSPSAGSIDSVLSSKPPPIPPSHHSLQHLTQRSFSPSLENSTSTIGIPISTSSVPISLLTNNLQQSQLSNQKSNHQQSISINMATIKQQQIQQAIQISSTSNHSNIISSGGGGGGIGSGGGGCGGIVNIGNKIINNNLCNNNMVLANYCNNLTTNVITTTTTTTVTTTTPLSSSSTTTPSSPSPPPKSLLAQQMFNQKQQQQHILQQNVNNCSYNNFNNTNINNFQQQKSRLYTIPSSIMMTTTAINIKDNYNSSINIDIANTSGITDSTENQNISGNGNSLRGDYGITTPTTTITTTTTTDNKIIQSIQFQEQQLLQQHQSDLSGNLSNSLYSHHQLEQQHQSPQQQQLQYNQSSNIIHSRKIGHNVMAPPPPKGPRHPPAYSVAAQMARLHRLGRAHSHEGVTSSATGTISSVTATPNVNTISNPSITNQQQQPQQLICSSGISATSGYYQHHSHHRNMGVDDDDDDAQVSAV